MTAVESLVLAYLLNAAWQLPLLAGCGWLLLRGLREPSPRLEYAVWFLTVWLAAIVPLSVGLGLFSPARMSTATSTEAAFVPEFLLRSLLGLLALPSLWRLVRTLHATVATIRLQRRAKPLFHRLGITVRQLPAEFEAAGPLLTGVFRPLVLIPGFLTEPEHEPLLQAALAHEVAHWRRRDLLTHFASEILLLPLAYHPLTDWLRQKLHAARELACDAEAKTDAVEYARCLLAIARRAVEPARPLAALGIGDARTLERRIHALASPPTRMLSRGERYAAVALLALACGGLMTAARTQYLWLSSVPAPRVFVRRQPAPPPAPLPPAPAQRSNGQR